MTDIVSSCLEKFLFTTTRPSFFRPFGGKRQSRAVLRRGLLLSCVPSVASVTLRDAERFDAKKEAKKHPPLQT